jgi:hypothetical protein
MGNKSTKAVLTIICAIAVPIAAVLFLRASQYYQRDYLDNVEAIWNPDELFILLQTGTSIEKTPRWNVLLAKYFGLWVPAEGSTVKNLVVFHFRDQKLVEFKQQGFYSAGVKVPINGVLHILQGGYSITGFKWAGDRFIKIDSESLERIQARLRSEKDILRTSGWRKLDWKEIGNINGAGTRTFPMELRGATHELQIKVDAPIYDSEGYMARDSAIEVSMWYNMSQKTLIGLDQNWKRIAQKDFQEIMSRTSVGK